MKRALFLHGFTGAGSSWSPLTASLKDCFEATCPDLPGHVGAALPARAGRLGFEAVVEALASGIDKPTAVVGYSQGARLALALAVRHPAKVSRLILESGTPGLVRHHDRALRQAEDEARAVQIETSGVDAFIREWERLPLFKGIPPSDTLNARRRSHAADGLAGALRCMGLGVQPSFWSELPQLRVPTLLITGAHDAKFTGIARKMAAELTLGWHVIVPNAGHAVHLEAPGVWVREVRDFAQAVFSHEYQPEEQRP